MRTARFGTAMLAVLALTGACAGTSVTPTSSGTPAVTAPPSPTAVATGTVQASPVQSPPATTGSIATPVPSATATPVAAVFDQPWATASLTDVTTGEQFTLAGLAAGGRVVFVETMAIWCTSCEAQQRVATQAFAQLDPARVEWVALDVESSERADALALYRELNGFPFRYAVSDTAMSRALADEFGDIVLSPPSINVIVLAADGEVTHLRGWHSMSEIIELAAAHGA